MLNKKPLIVTHDGTFHADDAMAIAVCQLYFGSNEFSLIRTRDEDTIKKADYVFDVGNIYDPSTNRFDHHMKNGPTRSFNINFPYSSAGLAWKQFGMDIINYITKCQFQQNDVKLIFNKVDSQVFIPIDLIDNGIGLEQPIFTISHIIGNMNPNWNEDILEAVAFEKAVNFSRKILVRNINSVISDIDAVYYIKNKLQIINKNYLLFDDQVLFLPIKIPFTRAIYSLDLNNIKFVITPENGNYLISTIPDNDQENGMRLGFPKEWASLRNEELEAVTGISGSLFCHANLFIAGATSFEAAKMMTLKALKG